MSQAVSCKRVGKVAVNEVSAVDLAFGHYQPIFGFMKEATSWQPLAGCRNLVVLRLGCS